MDGLKTCKVLSDDGIMVNVTLCFSPAQAILAAKAGASFISPYVGRLDDIGHDRSEEHTSELQSLMRISYAVFCLKKKKYTTHTTHESSGSRQSGHTASYTRANSKHLL